MTESRRWTIRAPSRLHFGLLGWGPDAPRQFGGAGLMIEKPGLDVTAEVSASGAWLSGEPGSDRAVSLARRAAEGLAERLGLAPDAIAPLRLSATEHAPSHVGLGTGTQRALAVARLVAMSAGLADVSVEDLAHATGRGRRSGVGLHGFERGGLIVDGGRRRPDDLPPLLSRLEFPDDWAVLVVVPPGSTGLHDADERAAFEHLPAMSDAVSDRLCRLLLMGLMPAVVERDLPAFGASLTAIQMHVGRAFAPAQGGRELARDDLAPIVEQMRRDGLAGVGQSSWGPALYGFAPRDPEFQAYVLERVADRFALPPGAAFWTEASRHGARVLESGPDRS